MNLYYYNNINMYELVDKVLKTVDNNPLPLYNICLNNYRKYEFKNKELMIKIPYDIQITLNDYKYLNLVYIIYNFEQLFKDNKTKSISMNEIYDIVSNLCFEQEKNIHDILYELITRFIKRKMFDILNEFKNMKNYIISEKFNLKKIYEYAFRCILSVFLYIERRYIFNFIPIKILINQYWEEIIENLNKYFKNYIYFRNYPLIFFY